MATAVKVAIGFSGMIGLTGDIPFAKSKIPKEVIALLGEHEEVGTWPESKITHS
jgi:hypothetical protein